MKIKNSLLCLMVGVVAVLGQSIDAYKPAESDSSKGGGGLIDLKKLSVNQSVSYGMATGYGSNLMSQGLYTTMLTYKFTQPVTVHLNFGLPLMSSFNSAQNLTSKNLQSMDYFRSMPIDFSMSWQPRDNLLFQVSVMRNTGYGYGLGGGYGYGGYGYYDPFSPFSYMRAPRTAASSEDKSEEEKSAK